LAYLIDFKQYFANELNSLNALQNEGMLEIDEQGIHISSRGWFFVRAIAMKFDRYLLTDQNRARFSKII